LWGYVYYPTMEKSIFSKYVTVPLMISLFVCGIQISKENWKSIVQRPRFIAIGVLIRWVAPPVCAYILGQAILGRYLPQPAGGMLAIGMVILATTPTGPASNTMTLISRGDLALSVSVTAMNNILAPFLQPFLIALLAGSFIGHVNTRAIFVELIEMVLAPVILGSIVGGIYPEQVKKIKPALGAIAVLCLSFIMLANISKGTATLLKTLWIIPWMLGACAVQTVAVLCAGFYIPKLFRFTVKQRVATTFEVAVENASLATVVALNHFSPLAALPAIFYGKLQHMFGIGIFVRKFQNMPELTQEEPLSEVKVVAKAAKAATSGD
jgi:BASS family bile acid:Na+ symporter